MKRPSNPSSVKMTEGMLRSPKVLTQDEATAVRTLYAVNLAVTIAAGNPTDVSERYGAAMQLAVFAEDVEDAIQKTRANLAAINPGLEILGIVAVVETSFIDAQFINQARETTDGRTGAGIILTGGNFGGSGKEN